MPWEEPAAFTETVSALPFRRKPAYLTPPCGTTSSPSPTSVYKKSDDGIAKITINRPEVRNAFRPLTVQEMLAGLRPRP